MFSRPWCRSPMSRVYPVYYHAPPRRTCVPAHTRTRTLTISCLRGSCPTSSPCYVASSLKTRMLSDITKVQPPASVQHCYLILRSYSKSPGGLATASVEKRSLVLSSSQTHRGHRVSQMTFERRPVRPLAGGPCGPWTGPLGACALDPE